MRALVRRLGLDGVLALLFVIGAVAAYVETFSFRGGAADWPQWVLIAFALLSLLVVIMRLIFPENRS